MGWDEVVEEVSARLPNFNDYTLVQYRNEQVASMPEFVGHIYSEAAKLVREEDEKFGGELIYKGYTCLTPEARLNYSVMSSNTSIKGQYNIQASEVALYEYIFEYKGIEYPVHIYLPYMHNGSLQIKDTKYYIQHAIIDRTIHRIPEGINIKVMRSPVQCWRSEQLAYTDIHGTSYMDAVITTQVYFGKTKASKSKSRSKVRMPLILYLLAKYNLDEIVTRLFGLPANTISFVSEPDKEDTTNSYFKANNNVYLRVNKEMIMEETMYRRLVASLLYILKMAKSYSLVDVHNITFYRIILGRRLHSQTTKDGLANSHAVTHLSSLDTYLDHCTKKDLADIGINCNDIYDLFTAVFFNIDSWLLDYSPNDLFARRIGGVDIILAGLVKTTFNRFYNTIRKKTITDRDIRNMLKMDPMRISSISKNKIAIVRNSISMYNGNMLLTTFIKKTRQTNPRDGGSSTNTNLLRSREHQFHISFPVVESILAISSNSPGSTGDLNPFAAIDRKGNFVRSKMPWVEELEVLNRYLVQS